MPIKPDDAVLPCNRLPNQRRRTDRARDKPGVTCAASRHVHHMALCLLRPGGYPMLADEPQECAASMLSVLESLWKARTELARLRERAKETASES